MNCAIILVTFFIANVPALSVDNQLVNARNDCFERIALEAMLPFEKTFRTEDTNSLNSCKEMCITAGDNCQAISFGVHRRGNGTCQLSSEKIDSTGSRPSGTIFDPDFDLYSRKTNCFDLQDNTIPFTDTYDPTSTSNHGPSRPNTVAGSPILIVDSSPTPGTVPLDTDRYAPPPSPTPTGVFSTNYPSSSDNTRYQPTRRPSTTMGNPGDGYTTGSSGDRIYFSHDVYPLYKYPMLYEQNYPAPNQEVYYPGGYAQNVPNLGDRYKPSYPIGDDHPHHDTPRPIFGLGYGNGYSYGQPVKYDSRPTSPGSHVFSHLPDNRPTPTGPGYTGSMMPGNGNRVYRPEYDHTTSSYYPRPGSGSSSSDSTMRPNGGLDFTNRPDPAYGNDQTTQGGGGYGIPVGPTRPPKRDGPRPGYGYVSQGQNNYGNKNGSGQEYDNDKNIATFFNPDDYGQGNRKSKGLGFKIYSH